MRGMLQAVLAILLAAVVFAQDALPQRMLDAQPVSIQFRNASLPDVFGFLAKASGVTIRLSPEVDSSVAVNVRFANAKVTDVFNFLLKAGNLNYTVENDSTIVVTPRRP